MRSYFTLALLFLAVCPWAGSQAAPAATAGRADLRYAVRYSESVEFGDTLGTWHTIDASGSLDYTNGRTQRPFSLDYMGGYGSTISGPSYGTGVYQRVWVSQGFNLHKWIIALSDDVGYRPQAPTTGFSGMPGIGEPIGGPYPPSSQQVLTVDTHSLNNDAWGEVQHNFGRGSSLHIDAQHHLLRYPDGGGLATDQIMTSAGPSFRLNVRNTVGINYAFSRFSYPDFNTHFQTDTVMCSFHKSWNRAFQSDASVGPEFVQKSGSVPASTGVAAQAALEYQLRRFTANVNYSRTISGGSGYMMGSQSESITASASRSFTQKFFVEIIGGYQHNTELTTGGDIKSDFGSAQASWRIGRYLNAFANYSASSQLTSYMLPSNVLNGLIQTVAFGFGFSKDIKGAK